MSDSMTSDTLINSVKNRAHVPENQVTFEAQDFLDFATEELRLGLVPIIMGLHEDYFLTEVDIPVVVGKKEYEIPSRAMGNKLKDVQFKLRDGGFSEMTRIGIGDRFDDFQSRMESELRRYYVKNNKIVLLEEPSVSSGSSLTFIFFMRPSKLVEEDRIAIISGINRTSGQIVVDQVPENFSTQVVYDLYKATSPYSNLAMDFNLTNINSATNTIEIDPTLIPDELAVGDHLALAGECIIPQVPGELHVMLAQMVACRLLESQGDSEGLKNALLKLQQMQNAAGMIVDNRVDDSPRKVINRFSPLRNSTFSKKINNR